MYIPSLIDLPDIMAFVDDFSKVDPLMPEQLAPQELMAMMKDVRCFVKYFYASSPIPALTKQNAIMRCVKQITRILNCAWSLFEGYEYVNTEDLTPQ